MYRVSQYKYEFPPTQQQTKLAITSANVYVPILLARTLCTTCIRILNSVSGAFIKNVSKKEAEKTLF